METHGVLKSSRPSRASLYVILSEGRAIPINISATDRIGPGSATEAIDCSDPGEGPSDLFQTQLRRGEVGVFFNAGVGGPAAGEVYGAYWRRPHGQSGVALLRRYFKELWALAGVEMPGVQRREQVRGIRAGATHHHPVATPVGMCRAEVCVVGGDDLVEAILAEQTIDITGTVPLAGIYCTGGIENLYGPCSWHGEQVLIGQIVPCGMGGSHVGAGRLGPFRQLRTGLPGAWRHKVDRQTNGQNVPLIAQTGRRSVQLRSQDGGKPVAAVRHSVGDGELIALREVVCQTDEVIAPFAV